MSAAASTAGDAAAAQKKWESDNNVQVVQPDEIYKYDETKYEEFLRSKPWSKECVYAWPCELLPILLFLSSPHYFKTVKISAVALLKLVRLAPPVVPRHWAQFLSQVMHAASGGKIEVMGVLQGKVEHETFVIFDAFALPVEATEVRVNAMAEAYEYMVEYKLMAEEVPSIKM